MARVVLEHLTKVFRGPKGESIRAVEDLNLAVEDKELLVLLGPSGCGKTTTLRLIAGLEELDSGAIAIGGQLVNRVPPKDRDVAMVFQNPALYPHLSVAENMAFGLKLRRCPKAEIMQRVKAAAELLGLSGCLERKPMALSGGQRQRVALGRALVRRPRVFLFDEPLSNLDAPLRAQMRLEIARLHRQAKTATIYVTHEQAEAMALGRRIALMREGRLEQVGEPLSLYRQPANRFVAGFLGSPPMNFFEGTVTPRGNALVFEQLVPRSSTLDPLLRLRVDERLATRLQACIGKRVVLGLRPEHISASLAGPGLPEAASQAVVEAVEPMGAETYLRLAGGGHLFAARLALGQRVSVGQKVALVFDMAEAHFFDPATAQAIR